MRLFFSLFMVCVILVGYTKDSYAEIEIEANRFLKVYIRDSLAFLKENSPKDYEFVQKYVAKIEEHSKTGAYVEMKTIHLNGRSCTEVYWCSSAFVHEAVHMEIYEAGREIPIAEEEREAGMRQLEYLKRVKAPERIISHVEEWIEKGNHYDLDGDGDYDWDDYNLRNY